jgi:hypothetical protein
LKTSEKDATPTISRDSRRSDPPALDRDDPESASNPANPRRVDSGVDTKASIDLARAVALATAMEAFVSESVRPLARDLVDLLRAAQPGAAVVSLPARRRH